LGWGVWGYGYKRGKMITFHSLRVENLFSYGEAYVEFKPGLYILEGRNLDRDGSSNMVGKSALWDALATVLWEENSRGQVKDDVVNKAKKTGEGAVVFSRDGKVVSVRYVRGEEKKWIANVNGKVESYAWDVMKKRVKELVGMSYTEFVLTSWFQQGMMDSFLVKSDAEKKDLFVKWLGLDVFKEMREKVKERKREVEADVRAKKELLKVVERLKEVGVSAEEVERAQEVLRKWKNMVPVPVEEYKRKRGYVLEQLKRWRDAVKVEGLIKELRKVRDELSGKVSNLSEKRKWLKDGRCWVCGSEVDTEKFLAEVSSEVDKVRSALAQVESNLRALEEVYIKGKGVDRERLLKEIAGVRKRIGDVDEYRRAVEVVTKVEEQERQRKVVGDGIDVSVIEELEWELETSKRWEKGLSDDGVVAYVLEKVLVVFNELLKKYGRVLGIDVEFRIGKRGQLEVEVSDGWKSMNRLDWWSGSEKYLVMLVVMLGISEFLNYMGKGTNLLVMDEVFAPFDRVNREKVVELLKWLQGGDKAVVVVTHHEDVKRSVDWSQVWVVERRDGVSRLMVEG
jgi:DNA repair exonuclease SbcCD ATPase subunit